MKLVRYDDGGAPESWVMEGSHLHSQLFDAGGSYNTCHIQRLETGKYQLNDAGFHTTKFVGPEFDTPEACALWVALGGRVEE